MEQLSLFDFEHSLKTLLEEVIQERELPKKSLHLYSNRSIKNKSETSKSICIYEPEYPAVKEDIDNPGKNYVVMNFIQKELDVELLIRPRQYKEIQLPQSAAVKSTTDKNFIHIVFSKLDASVFDYIKQNILYCLKNYHSNSKTFGCCSRFMECSDALKCVHENKLYSTSCTYRHHLESGKIFYGKNKNV